MKTRISQPYNLYSKTFIAPIVPRQAPVDDYEGSFGPSLSADCLRARQDALSAPTPVGSSITTIHNDDPFLVNNRIMVKDKMHADYSHCKDET